MKNISFKNTNDTFVNYNSKAHRYCGKSHIFKTYRTELLITNNNLFDELINEGYKYFRRPGQKTFSIANWEYIHEVNRNPHQSITFYKPFKPSEISSFYRLEIWLEINGNRFMYNRFATLPDKFPNELIMNYLLDNEAIINKRIEIDPWEHRGTVVLIPITDIDKIIGIKYEKNPILIDTDNEMEDTGEKEEITLDLKNFNNEIYNFFLEHNILEIEF